MAKGNEDLKAKIAKIQQKGKAPAMPNPEPHAEEDEVENDEASMEALEAEFEAKKKALMQKVKALPQSSEAEIKSEVERSETVPGLEEAIEEYSDEAKFRVELVFQLVQLNKSMKDIADALKALNNNE